ncbi:RNA-binding S4 domain-containing protein [Caldicellulosiruptor acetigenus]|uniref:RNA-binding S4 domain-containing protein n=1 Tax=Caldicellulosiruptor acetigenus TaxID=301953 RepID=UPI00041CEAB1|nr:RNA-binding S4 domain-containing protein [Caldicellulosiruptor acetigenus]WAM35666.1 RNA-binding S4 domain-containing protein [Caldicellulosiruptor acetigenus]
MRIDKYLKVSRIIKRRTLAQEACEAGRVFVNGKVAKPSTDVKVGDVIEVHFGDRVFKCKVTSVDEKVQKNLASSMYEVME